MGYKEEGCIFCDLPKEKRDNKNYILYRGNTGFIIMNIYPYNNGHLMIAPFRHTPDLDRLTKKEKAELMEIMALSMKILTGAFKPEGFNLGMNVGRIAGAGVTEHLHIHVIPRWKADTNFMPVIAETKVIGQHLDTTFKQLKSALRNLAG